MEPRHILIVEDSPTQARFTAMLLERAGHRVSVAGTGQAGLASAEAYRPDVVLLDVVLPDLDGFEVCRRLRQSGPGYIPVLMLTEQRTSLEDKVDALATGADDYLAKPFDERELLARLAALLRIKQVIDELHQRLTSEHQSYQALKRIALTDHLTGLYNRHYFAEVLAREFGLSQRYGSPLACILSDIDHFRDFNNRLGHAAGDWVLRQTAALMQDLLRQGDVMARYGGEEFVVLLPMTELEPAARLAERLRVQVAGRRCTHPAFGEMQITISLGVAGYPSPAIMEAEQLLVRADEALYRAKAGGRNRAEVYRSAPPVVQGE